MTEGLFNRLDEIIAHHPPKMFILIGINDVQKNVKLKDTKDNYRKIVEKLKYELPETIVFMQSVLPTGLGTTEKVEEINNYLRVLAEETGVVFIDLNPAFLNSNGSINKELYAGDNLHLNGKGYATWIELIRRYVN